MTDTKKKTTRYKDSRHITQHKDYYVTRIITFFYFLELFNYHARKKKFLRVLYSTFEYILFILYIIYFIFYSLCCMLHVLHFSNLLIYDT